MKIVSKWTLLSGALGAAAIACGGASDAVDDHGLRRCYEPAGSYEVCYETLGHTRPAGDIIKGSPGISLRVFGRAQGQDIPLTSTRGGPEMPSHWSVACGLPACYDKQVDYRAVIDMARQDVVAPNLQRHRDFALIHLERLSAHLFPTDPPNRCDGITKHNMVDRVREEEARMAAKGR